MDTRTWMYTAGAWMLALVLGLAALPAHAQDSATLTGTVLDAQDGTTLIGANVALRETDSPDVVDGTATNPDGAFRLTDIPPGQYVLEVRFVGYRTQQRTLTLEAGETRDVTVELPLSTASLETVVVSASRRQEKVLDAPASISVFQPEEIQSEVNTSTVDAIRSAPGVDMAQTGIDRREVVLRGFNEAFSGATYVLTDYRESAVPSLGVNLHAIMPNMSVDVERIEVVRGPGSALYGPGVDSGVIHYFTKDPFQHPGTTVSVAGGTRDYFAGQFRHAGVVADNFGYKITGQYARATEWQLDPSDPPDQREIDRYRVYQDPNDPALSGCNFVRDDFDGDGSEEAQLRRQDLYQKFNVNGLLQYKAGDATTISLNGGYSELTGVVQSGIGTLQADGFGYAYGQLRVQSGGLFAQIYLNANDSGTDTYVYGTGNQTIDKGLQWNGQAQYDFDVSSIGTQVIAGIDADLTIPRTEGQILGRNEDDDDIQEYGAYTQTTTDLTESLELTLAGRLDYNNVVETLQLSPRAALVFKLNSSNTVRASYNRSFSSPGTNSLFLDLPAQRQTLGQVPGMGGGTFDLVFQGLGAADGFTFDNFRQNRTVQFFIPAAAPPSLPFDNFFGQSVSLSQYPVVPVYGATAQGFASRLGRDGAFAGTRFQDLTPQARQEFAQLLSALTNASGGSSLTDATVLGIPDDTEQLGYDPLEGGPTDIDPLGQTTTQTFEVGYKGVLANRLIINIDGYYEQKQDFIGPLVVESPFVYLSPEFIGNDVQARLGADLNALSAFQDFVQASGLSEEQAVRLVAGTFGSTASGVVQPDQNVLPGNDPTNVGAFLSYRNFGNVQYWGIDASIQAQVTDQIDAYANVSIVSDDFFDNEELDEEGTSLSLALNAPSFKMKGGASYNFDFGLTIGASGNYVQGFPVETGPYVGEVDDYFLLDARVGYDFQEYVPGLTFNLTAKNVLDNEHREFVGAPELGRFFMTRLTYTLP